MTRAASTRSEPSGVVTRTVRSEPRRAMPCLRANAASREEEALLGAKMVGRWQSGAPLALSPERDDPELGADASRNNDFLYYEDDPRGFKCPAGSHARRMNPRDSLRDEGVEVRLHRMIRR